MKHYNPTTPGRRGMTTIDRGSLAKTGPLGALSRGRAKAAGRNTAGRITVRHKGGGHKRRYRLVDFYQEKHDIPARVLQGEYDPYRTSFIALVVYADGEKRYILLPQDVKPGDSIIAAEDAAIKPGNRLPLRSIPVGAFVYNVEAKPAGGGKFARSAGVGAEVLAHDAGFAHLKMPSREVRMVPDRCWASIGRLSREEHQFITVGKAGRARWMGKRPTVRGSAMNPVDHPLGGGEGRAPRGMRRPKNKWGKGVRGVKTRKRKKYSNSYILQRRA